MHCMQASLSAFQTGLSLYMLMTGVTGCNDLEAMTCRLMMVSKLLYDGLLLSGWVPGEQWIMAREGHLSAAKIA